MKSWSRYPVFRVLIPFSVGILAANYFEFSMLLTCLPAFLFLLVSYFFTTRNYATGKYADRWLAGIPFYICFLALGGTIASLQKPNSFAFEKIINQQVNTFIVELSAPPDSLRSGYRSIGKVTAFSKGDEWISCSFRLLIYFKDSSHTFEGTTGDKFLIGGRIQTIPAATNPGAFNYKKYMEGKGILYQCFVNENESELLQSNSDYSLYYYAQELRKIMLHKLQFYLEGKDRLGVAGALLLGYDDWLDPELEKHYAAAGVLHILCVSGMHVGLIFIILGYMLKWMNRNTLLRNLKFILLIAFVWFYAMVTGLAPSVVRASSMITIVIIGRWIDKSASIYNILCTSCIVLFAFDPNLMFNAGFQLSFLAVCGIVFFHRMIKPLLAPKNQWLQKGWELISVSIAAQLSTFPLSIYLFHQFPNYFILGNLFIVPLSTLVMYSGLALLVTDFIPYLGFIMAFVTKTAIDLLNFLVHGISSLPGSVTTGVFISFAETILLYLLLILIPLWLTLKTRTMLFASLVSLILLLGMRIQILMECNHQFVFTVYQSNYSTVASLFRDRKAVLFLDTTVSEKQIKYNVEGHIIQSLVTDPVKIPVHDNSIYEFPEPKIVLVKNWLRYEHPKLKNASEPIALLVLGGNLTVSADSILQFYHPAKVIFDSSCRNWQVKKLQEGFSNIGISTHDVRSEGTFQLNFQAIR